MSFRNWYDNNAHWIALAGGILIVGIFFRSVFYSEGYQAANQDQKAHYESYRIAEEAYRECASSAAVEEALRCYQEAEKASREDHRAEQDLNAQRQMADWAKWMFYATAVVGALTVGVTGVGIYWVKETLAETQKAVKAAEDAVAVTREMGERQMRAYIWIETSEMKDVGANKTPYAHIGIKNYGQTPAQILGHKSWLGLYHYPNIGEIQYPDAGTVNPHPLGPSRENAIFPKMARALTQQEYDALKEGRAVFLIYGRVEYEDIFGDRHWITYRMKHGGDIGVERQSLAWTSEGNEASYFEGRTKDG